MKGLAGMMKDEGNEAGDRVVIPLWVVHLMSKTQDIQNIKYGYYQYILNKEYFLNTGTNTLPTIEYV